MSSGGMRTALVLLLALAAAVTATAVSGHRTADGDSNSRESSTSSQAEMILESIVTAIRESRAPPPLTKILELIADSYADGTSTGASSSSAPWASKETLKKLTEVLARIAAGTNSSNAGTNDTIAGSSGSNAVPNNTLLPETFWPWSVEEILERIASSIEFQRKMQKISSGTMRSWFSMEVTGCASLILRMAPCIIDFLDPLMDGGLRNPTGPCCSGVLAVSTPSAAGGAACACHLFRDPLLLDLHLDVDRVDALFSACDGFHFPAGSFAKLCRETITLPPLVMFLDPVPDNITNTPKVPELSVPPVKPDININASREMPENTSWGRTPEDRRWGWTSGAAELLIGGVRGLFLMATLFLLFTATFS